MKVLKKFLCVVLVCVFGCSSCCVEGSALVLHASGSTLIPNALCCLNKGVIKEWSKLSKDSLSEEEIRAFISGSIYANIGRFRFNKECGVKSASYEFQEELMKHAKTSEEKWFARGWDMDGRGWGSEGIDVFLSNIFDKDSESTEYFMRCGSKYFLNCSLLDNYFIRKSGCVVSNEFLDMFNFKQVSAELGMATLSQGLGVPEDKVEDASRDILNKHQATSKKYQLVLHGDLIKEAYKSFGLELSLDDIYEQAANVVAMGALISGFASEDKIPKPISQEIKDNGEWWAHSCSIDLGFSTGHLHWVNPKFL